MSASIGVHHCAHSVTVTIPGLRDRTEDIPLLAQHFLEKANESHFRHISGISESVLKVFSGYNWPGNVRELEHTIEKALILLDNKVIDSSALFFRSQTMDDKSKDRENVTLEEMEKALIERAMQNHENNISAIAKELGISRPTLYSKIKKYGL